MKRSILQTLALFTIFSMTVTNLHSNNSIYVNRMNDPQAVYFTSGTGDRTEALQKAINEVEEKGVFGIVFIPSGNYELTNTIHIWKGIRLIGYGPTRPVFTLPAHTSGFEDPSSPKYLFHFTSNRPPKGQPIRDANPGTFYSAITNVDIHMGQNNPGAVGIRSHFAQHGFVSHVRFETGDSLAGIDEVGNIVHDCEFIGGQYGIMTKKPSPSWPFALLDSQFSNQKRASILTQEAGLSIIRCEFKEAPYVIEIRKDRSEELVMQYCHFSQIEKALIRISEETNARTQINIMDSSCEEITKIAEFRESGRQIEAPNQSFYIQHFSHGLHIDGIGQTPIIDTRLKTSIASSEIKVFENPARQVPSNQSWINVKDLGANGDGNFDNTQILQKAINTYDSLYFPTGRYRVTDTLQLKNSTCILGLNPITTQILIKDQTPAFHPAGSLKAVIESSCEGDAIIQGIGIDAGAANHRAVALKWQAGEQSLVNDIKFMGGHGTYDSEGNYLKIYNHNRSADPDSTRRWDSMPPSLWVTNNGGGTFQNLWTASPYAHAGMLVENTSTPGWIYQISSEHHIRNELIFENVKGWKSYALQFEEESTEGRKTLPLRINSCTDLEFNNTYIYRVNRTFTPYPNGIIVSNSKSIQFHGIHAYGPSKFTVDNTLYHQDSDQSVRSREIAYLKIPGQLVETNNQPLNPKLLADGFNHIDSPEIDSKGNLYFVDAGNQSIHRWNREKGDIDLIMDLPIEPSQILLYDDKTLLIFTRTGKLYQFPTNGAYGDLQLINASSGVSHFAKRYALPTTRWRDSHDFLKVTTEEKPSFFKYEDLVIPLESNYLEAKINTTYFRTLDLERTYDIQAYQPGESVYVSDEFAQKTWLFKLSEEGTLVNPILFAEEGEAGVAVDNKGQVYIAAGQVFVYSEQGVLVQIINTPQRPTALAIGGANKQTLYILARTALYSYELHSNSH